MNNNGRMNVRTFFSLAFALIAATNYALNCSCKLTMIYMALRNFEVVTNSLCVDVIGAVH